MAIALKPQKAASKPGGERRRLSIVRLSILLLVSGGLIAVGARWGYSVVVQSQSPSSGAWFAPYVDVTLTPTLHFEEPGEQPAKDVVLAFVVADPADHCSPSWGSYYSLDAAARALDLDRRVVRLREAGGDAMVSFGGALNQELAVACTDALRLAAAYKEVVDRYSLQALDFDIEGDALKNTAANERRAAAIKQLQAANPSLQVWLTLPVDPNGLPEPAQAVVEGMLTAGVKLAGVNVMTMNYSTSRLAGISMASATEQALNSTFQQLDGAYRNTGISLTDTELWQRIGATPMIGQNDVESDVFTLNDAEALLEFSRLRGMGRLSLWSANRDVRCGAGVTDKRASNTCSGIDQQPLAFGELFAAGTAGRIHGSGAMADMKNSVRLASISRDDPRTSPYPIWRAAKAYDEGSKVVWQDRVYQAKWWTQGNQPDAPVKHIWDTPWRYLGPVLASDVEALRTPAPQVDGHYSKWMPETIYVAGDTVESDGKAFRAKWWTQGDLPQEDPDQPYDHPWEYLGKAKAAG